MTSPLWLDTLRSAPLSTVAGSLELRVAPKWLSPCPACGEEKRGSSDKRGPVGYGAGGGWSCFRCGAKGGAVDMAFWRLTGRAPAKGDGEGWKRVRTWCEGSGIALEVHPLPEPAPILRPPLDDVRGILGASLSPADGAFRFASVNEFFQARGLRPADLGGVARVLPGPAGYRWPSWWPSSWVDLWRVVVPAWEVDGTLAAFHARSPYPEAKPKCRWPLGEEGVGFGRLLFACPRALRILRGLPHSLEGVLVTEGLTDFLATVQAARGLPGLAVLGGTSGSFQGLGAVRWGNVRIYSATDPDKAGRGYARQIADAVSPHRVVSIPLQLLPTSP